MLVQATTGRYNRQPGRDAAAAWAAGDEVSRGTLEPRGRAPPAEHYRKDRAVAIKNTFTYERQAQLSVVLAAIGGVAFLAAAVLLGRNFTWQMFWVVYNPKGMWLPTLGVTLLISLGAGVVGFFVGLNSAGQRRNTRSQLSWLGFFLNAGIIALAVCAVVFFYFARNPLAK